MKCFNHNEIDALGSCKSCHKGLCIECLFDTGNGLACKDSCSAQVDALHELNKCEKIAYKVGTKRSFFPFTVLSNYFCSISILSWGIYLIIIGGSFDYPLAIFGGGLLIFSIVAHVQYLKSRNKV
ncbi:MAG: hypothetical protein ACQ9MH_10940 [Nitrospinales bacterium]